MQQIPQHADQAQINRLADPAQHYLRDCSRVLIFTGNGQVLYSKACQASMGELQSLQSLFGAREDALRTGILLDNRRYEARIALVHCQALDRAGLSMHKVTVTRHHAVWCPSNDKIHKCGFK
ncbi:hypothetical protein WJX82_004850 [Trebouxia sp. C0006]